MEYNRRLIMNFDKHLLAITAVLGAGFLLPSTSCLAAGAGGAEQHGNLPLLVSSIITQNISPAEEVGIVQMREEEKLARDVYQVLYSKWQMQIFYNIAQSEQRHMDAMKALVVKYGVEDPVTDDAVGVFTDSNLQQLYSDLIARGQQSVVDALQVGATIEDLDIKDLNEFLEQTDSIDVRIVYQNLVKGSRNHLRSFVRQLAVNGATYDAQFLTADEIDAIISSPMERGRVDEDGDPDSGNNNRGGRGQGRGKGRFYQ